MKFRFSVLETKGQHLKGNDDTEYKRKLFELLTSYTENAIRAGEIELGGETQDITFTILMEDTWKDELIQSGVAQKHCFKKIELSPIHPKSRGVPTMAPITLHPQYIVDAANQKHSVILPLAEFEALMEDIEDLAR